MSLTSNFVVLGILCLLVLLGQYIASTRFGKPIGTALTVIILGALFANFDLIPTASNAIPLYSVIFTYLAPVSIFYLVLGVNLQEIRNAGLPMISLFLLGSAATVVGVVVAYYLVDPSAILGEFSSPMAGMIAGTYSGGSINFNAVAVHYKVSETGVLYAGAIAVDNVISTLWVIATLMIPKVMHKLWPGKKIHVDHSPASVENSDESKDSFQELYFLIPLGFVAFFVTEWVGQLIPQIPSMLTITTIGIVLAQFAWFKRLKMAQNLGLYLVYLFLVVIGAFCEFEAIGQLGDIGQTLMLFFGLTVVIHGALMLTIGRLFFSDWQMIAIASQANVGGGTTAMALAQSMGRKELIVPAILVGSLGGAMGTYIGFTVAGLL
jgi:uncharacterized membrane protein